MKKQFSLWLMAAVVAALGCSAQAATYSGDLLVGFTKQSGNDVIYDLGPASVLTNGQSWNLSALLSGFNLTNVSWGVIGDKSGTPHSVWTTTAGLTPLVILNNTGWATVDTPTKSIYQNFTTGGAGQSLTIAATDDNSWNKQAINGALTTQYHNAYEDPTVTGITSDSFFLVNANGSAPILVGSFTLAYTGVLTLTVAPPQLAIQRAGNVSSISFTSSPITAIYSLSFTNSSGLNASNWPSAAGTIVGDGTVKTFQDTNSAPIRFYRVKAR
jgi:hypothetical protein